MSAYTESRDVMRTQHSSDFSNGTSIADPLRCSVNGESSEVGAISVLTNQSVIGESSVNGERSVVTDLSVNGGSSEVGATVVTDLSVNGGSSEDGATAFTASPISGGSSPHTSLPGPERVGCYNKCISYDRANRYWSEVPDTLNGMLGGLGHISHIDLQGSAKFLAKLDQMGAPMSRARALDCGAGIGRVTRYLLSRHFVRVDLVEQCAKFVETARTYLKTVQQLGEIHCSGLQDFHVPPNTYDLIWCQWVLGHLTDSDLVAFLKRCSKGLRTNGVIIVKENICSVPAGCQQTRTSGLSADLTSPPVTSGLGADLSSLPATSGLGIPSNLSSPPSSRAHSTRSSENGMRCSEPAVFPASSTSDTSYSGSASPPTDHHVSRDVVADFDTRDSSVTRPLSLWLGLFECAGLNTVCWQVQRGFPRELYQVRMFALRPASFPLDGACVAPASS